MAQRTLCVIPLMLLVGCASVPPTEPELTAEQIEQIRELRERRQKEREDAAVADAKDALEYMTWLCALPPGPEREQAEKTALERNWRAACPQQPQQQPPQQ